MKKDFYFIGGVILFLVIAFLWQSYKQSSIEPYIFSSSASVRSDNICREIPSEDDYKISKIFDGEVNFAGKYSVATTTCGQSCEEYEITNLEEEIVYPFDLKSKIGARFSSTSSLFVINHPDDAIEIFSDTILTSYYKMEDNNLKLICKSPI